MSLEYLVIYECEGGSFGAYVPDLPGCVAVGQSLSRVRKLIREAIAFHIEGMKEDGHPVPEPTSTAEVISVKVV